MSLSFGTCLPQPRSNLVSPHPHVQVSVHHAPLLCTDTHTFLSHSCFWSGFIPKYHMHHLIVRNQALGNTLGPLVMTAGFEPATFGLVTSALPVELRHSYFTCHPKQTTKHTYIPVYHVMVHCYSPFPCLHFCGLELFHKTYKSTCVHVRQQTNTHTHTHTHTHTVYTF